MQQSSGEGFDNAESADTSAAGWNESSAGYPFYRDLDDVKESPGCASAMVSGYGSRRGSPA